MDEQFRDLLMLFRAPVDTVTVTVNRYRVALIAHYPLGIFWCLYVALSSLEKFWLL